MPEPISYGIRRITDDLWFGGFGPAPDYEVRWYPEAGAYTYADRDSAQGQALLLHIHDRPLDLSTHL